MLKLEARTMHTISYESGRWISVEEFIDVLRRSTLGERRRVDEENDQFQMPKDRGNSKSKGPKRSMRSQLGPKAFIVLL